MVKTSILSFLLEMPLLSMQFSIFTIQSSTIMVMQQNPPGVQTSSFGLVHLTFKWLCVSMARLEVCVSPNPVLDRRLPCGPVPVPRAPSPPLNQSNPNLSAGHEGSESGTPVRSSHRRDPSQGAAQSSENVSNMGAGRAHLSPADSMHTPPGQKSRGKKKSSKSSQYKRELNQGDLPPPPEPPPTEEATECRGTSLDRDGGSASSMERRGEHSTPYRRGAGQRRKEDEDIFPYNKPSFLTRGQVSSNCSTTGSSSSRGSTGSRGPGSSRKRSEEMR